jgi:hypothetical protein
MAEATEKPQQDGRRFDCLPPDMNLMIYLEGVTCELQRF